MPVDILHWSLSKFQTFILILMRVAPLLFLMPILNSRSFPILVKVGLAIMTSLVLLPLVQLDPARLPLDPWQFAIFLATETMIGFILSLAVNLVFAGIQFGGELVGFQMGLSVAQVIDPQSGVDSGVLSQFYYFLGVLIFLAVDGHHWFFRALSDSFRVLAPGEIHLRPGLYQHFLHLAGNMFVIAIRITAPVMAVLIFTQIALSILAKAVPQVNILMTSFPLTISLGFFFLGLSIEFFLPYFQTLFDNSGQGLGRTLLPLMQR